MVRDGLRLRAERDQLYQIRGEEVRSAGREGLESGEPIPAEEVFQELRQQSTTRRGQEK